MSHEQSYESVNAEYQGAEFGRTERIHASKQRRPTHGRKRGKVPQSFNGIHRRRKRKMSW